MEAKTILLVDDDPSILRLIAQVLRKSGYTVLPAQTAAAALETFAQHSGTIDLLIADVVMPAMNGPELLGRLLERDHSLRVLFISGYFHQALVRAEVLDRGFPLLAKPFHIARLLEAVREVIEQPQALTAKAT